MEVEVEIWGIENDDGGEGVRWGREGDKNSSSIVKSMIVGWSLFLTSMAYQIIVIEIIYIKIFISQCEWWMSNISHIMYNVTQSSLTIATITSITLR